MSDTVTRARNLVADHLGVDMAQITDEATFTGDLGADSLDTVELALAVEEEFELEMADDQAEAVFDNGCFADLVKWLQERVVAA